MGQPVLGVKQHRPKLAFMISYAFLVVCFLIAPIVIGIMHGRILNAFIIMFVLGGPLVIPLVNHCHAFISSKPKSSLLEELAVENPVYAI